MKILDFFEEEQCSKNWIVEHNSDDYLVSYCYEDHLYYVNCLTCCYGEYNIQPFIDYVNRDVTEISYKLFEKMLDDLSYNTYAKRCFIDYGYYSEEGYKQQVTVIDNEQCECAVECFYSITLAMLWLYHGYHTSGYEDLIWEEAEEEEDEEVQGLQDLSKGELIKKVIHYKNLYEDLNKYLEKTYNDYG